MTCIACLCVSSLVDLVGRGICGARRHKLRNVLPYLASFLPVTYCTASSAYVYISRSMTSFLVFQRNRADGVRVAATGDNNRASGRLSNLTDMSTYSRTLAKGYE